MAAGVKVWIKAARPHTLPLAISGILMGATVAIIEQQFNYSVFLMAVVTAMLLQILSNLANDYGDFKHGTDNDERVGPKRAVQQGVISQKQMKNAIFIVGVLSVLSGVSLLLLSVPQTGWLFFAIFLFIGLLAVWAAYHYTASDKPYGYRALGDISVFIFFGLVAVAGSAFLFTGHWSLNSLELGLAMGCLSAGVLNLNNVRDIENDAKSGKTTIAGILGHKRSLIYQLCLYLVASAFIAHFVLVNVHQNFKYLALIPLVGLFYNLFLAFTAKEAKHLYPLLKQLSLIVFFQSFVILLAIIF